MRYINQIQSNLSNPNMKSTKSLKTKTFYLLEIKSVLLKVYRTEYPMFSFK
ncbi:hypothetical protein LEP1GSC198_2475 [Leptospira kirschneri str. JB]|nr:hypothetical protein LEP1GSC198_2475 [Leptospira kirschneri str. JB]